MVDDGVFFFGVAFDANTTPFFLATLGVFRLETMLFFFVVFVDGFFFLAMEADTEFGWSILITDRGVAVDGTALSESTMVGSNAPRSRGVRLDNDALGRSDFLDGEWHP